MPDWTMKQDDTRPVLTRYLLQTIDAATSPIALTAASAVRFIMRHQGAPAVIATGIATITTPASGYVTYTWASGQTATAGTYDAEWEIQWADGGYQTVPNDTYMTVEIVADIGGNV
jgi:hypothetical protein